MHNYEGYSHSQVMESIREISRLGPVAKLKVARERLYAERDRQSYIKQNPSDIIETDFTKADELEYALRINSLANSLRRSWKDYKSIEHDDYGLIDYTEDYLESYMTKKYQDKNKKTY